MNKEKSINKILENRTIQVLLYTLVMFFFLLSFWSQGAFGSDECELFIKGKQIALGKRMYADITGQHMPIGYYLSALFYKLGAETTIEFRIRFYAFIALVWGGIFLYFGKRLGRLGVGLYPVIYMMIISGISSGTTIVGDQLQGIGMAILFYELVLFHKTKIIKFIDCIWVSISVMLSFGAAFTAVFAIFAIALTVLLLEIKDAYENKLGIGQIILYLVKKYRLLFATVVLPWVLLIIYYIRTDTVKAFVKWTYLFNREVYSKYISGYADNPVSAMFNGVGSIASTFNIDTISTTSIAHVIVISICVLWFIDEYSHKRDGIFIGGIIFFCVACATRGCFTFHGLAAIAVFSAIIGMYFDNHHMTMMRWVKNGKMNLWIGVICAFLFAASYLSVFPNALSFNTRQYIKTDSVEYVLGAITNKDEEIGFAVLDCNLLLNTGTVQLVNECGACPWFWEWVGESAMDTLNEKMPRVFVYNSEGSTWNYKIADYAPELKRFIDDNYINLYSSVYVTKDYYAQACTKIRPDLLFSEENSSGGHVDKIISGRKIEQNFKTYEETTITGLEIMTGTYGRTNSCTMTIDLVDNKSNKIVKLKEVNCTEFIDNGSKYIEIEPQRLLKEREYTIKFVCNDGTEDNSITIYHGSNVTDDSRYAAVDGVRQNYNLTISIYTDKEKPEPMVVNVIE